MLVIHKMFRNKELNEEDSTETDLQTITNKMSQKTKQLLNKLYVQVSEN